MQTEFRPRFLSFTLTGVVSVSVLLLLFHVLVMSSGRGRRSTGNLRHTRSRYEEVTWHVISAYDVERSQPPMMPWLLQERTDHTVIYKEEERKLQSHAIEERELWRDREGKVSLFPWSSSSQPFHSSLSSILINVIKQFQMFPKGNNKMQKRREDVNWKQIKNFLSRRAPEWIYTLKEQDIFNLNKS